MGEIAPTSHLLAPAKISKSHDLHAFSSGVPALDDWLRRRALANEVTGASRTYVVCSGVIVVGYYALALGSVNRAEAPGRVRRNMPDLIPVMVLGRFAVDHRWQGRGLGASLLRDAVVRTIQVAESAGVRALLVHAISDEAKRFYKSHGFSDSPLDPMTLFLPLQDVLRRQ